MRQEIPPVRGFDVYHKCPVDRGLGRLPRIGARPVWTFVNPLGDGVLTLTGSQAAIEVPGGVDHLVNAGAAGNQTPRLMQAANDVDFAVEVKFQSAVTAQYQTQGIVVEQDSGTYLQVEFYGAGSGTKLYVSRILNGGEAVKLHKATISGSPTYLRVTRVGDGWTVATSGDGVSWQPEGSFGQALNVTAVGVYGGNAGTPAPAHTAVVDYFANTAAPIIAEDGGEHTLTVEVVGNGASEPKSRLCLRDVLRRRSRRADRDCGSGWAFEQWEGVVTGSTNPVQLPMTSDQSVTAVFTVVDATPPVLSNIAVVTDETSATITWVTDEPATSSVAYGLSAAYEGGVVADSTLKASHSVTLTGLIQGTEYHYQISSGDAAGNIASSGDLTFTTSIPVVSSTLISDDFHTTVLDPAWTFVNPLGDGVLTLTGSQAVISVPAGVNHLVNAGAAGNQTARLMQAANDVDFEVEVKFESAVTARYQTQGIVVEQDNGTYLQFEFYGSGSGTKLYVGSIVNGSGATKLNKTTVGGSPTYLRVTRVGAGWTVATSSDGVSWQVEGSFGQALNVTGVGVYAGNLGSGGPAPAQTALIDYFFNTAAPVIPEN